MNPTLHTVLSLPSLHGIRSEFVIRSKADSLRGFADRLARSGVLRAEHFAKDAAADLAKACSNAMREFASAARPCELIKLDLTFTDYLDLGEPEGYLWNNKIRENFGRRRSARTQITHAHDPIGGFILHMITVMENGPYYACIGPALEYLENCRPRLGQTVFGALQAGLDYSCRGLTPKNGINWASGLYWMGEDSEKMRVDEELVYAKQQYKNLPPKDRKDHEEPNEDTIDVFRRQTYEDAFPAWAGTGRLRPFRVPELSRLRKLPHIIQSILKATLTILEWFRRPKAQKDSRNDCGGFEQTSWDMCPFLLVWKEGDPLTGIWDDQMENYSQTGEIMMDVNAVFGFHNDFTFRRALRRLRNYLELMHLTEDLIRLLKIFGTHLPPSKRPHHPRIAEQIPSFPVLPKVRITA